MSAQVYDIPVRTIDGHKTTLSEHQGKVLLVVNVASQCGFTPQYGGLEELWKTYGERGLVVLGFPCNQFGGQEPGSNDQIAQFCETHFSVTFPMFDKVEVKGPGAHPLFDHLTEQKRGLLGTKAIKWNFTKFLILPDGTVSHRFPPKLKPTSPKVISAIEAALERVTP